LLPILSLLLGSHFGDGRSRFGAKANKKTNKNKEKCDIVNKDSAENHVKFKDIVTTFMGVWQAVAMDSLKFHPGLACPTILRLAGGQGAQGAGSRA
jgi:hypothetical protein